MTTDVQFSTREVPWMKLGKLIEKPANAKEAAKLGGLDFEVKTQEIYWVNHETQGFHAIPSRNAMIRQDTGEFMGIVSSSSYHTLQFSDAFEFMDTVEHDGYVAAGSLRSGRQGFMVVKPQVDFNPLGGEDPHDVYLVLRTSHDCSRATEILMMPLRKRCMNQLTLKSFAKHVDYRWSIKHTSTQAAKLAEAQESLKKVGVYLKRYAELADKLASKTVNTEKGRYVLEKVIPMPKSGKTERTEIQWKERISSIVDLWQTSPTVAYAGTAWGLVNAVSEHFDWLRTGGTPESRFISALEGQTHKKLNQTALQLLAA